MHGLLRTKIAIKANSKGELPSEIQLLSIGSWETPYHGTFEVTAADIAAYVMNFRELFQANDKDLPINYDHTYDMSMGHKAAGWIKDLIDKGADGLWAAVEWTKAGAEAIAEGEWKYISPEFWPSNWTNPEDIHDVRDNVLDGAAVTNTPLFKGLKPIAASANSSNIIYIKGNTAVDLKELRKKKPADLTEDEKKHLAEHASELTAEERKTFELQTDEEKQAEADAEAKAKADKEAADKAAQEEADRKNASAKTGTVTMTAEEVAALKASAQKGEEAHRELERRDLAEKVNAHVKRGAIKSAEADAVTDLLLASSKDHRERWQKVLASIPDSTMIGETGSGAEGTHASAQEELMKRAAEVVKASAGKTTLSEATKEILNTDVELQKKVNAERAGGNQ